MGYRILGSVGRTLIAAGVLLLAFAAFQLWGTNIEEGRRQEDLAGSLAQSVGTDLAGADEGAKADALADTLQGRTGGEAPAIPVGEGLGVIEIPKIGVKKIIVEGVNKDDLRKGPGHYPGTPLPGQPGNAAIAGHRTTYGAPFNRIDELVPGDEIVVFTPQGKFTYQVIPPPDGAWKVIERGPGWFSVRPDQSTVLAATTDNRLTLTACHPKLSAEQRIIVVAKLIDTPAATTSSTSSVPVTTNSDNVGSNGNTNGNTDATDAIVEAPHAAPAEAFDAGFRGDDGALLPAILWGLAAAFIWFAAWLVRTVLTRDEGDVRWRRRFWVWMAFLPVFAVPLWFSFFYIDRFLPSF